LVCTLQEDQEDDADVIMLSDDDNIDDEDDNEAFGNRETTREITENDEELARQLQVCMQCIDRFVVNSVSVCASFCLLCHLQHLLVMFVHYVHCVPQKTS